jgi:hypothetical protein
LSPKISPSGLDELLQDFQRHARISTNDKIIVLAQAAYEILPKSASRDDSCRITANFEWRDPNEVLSEPQLDSDVSLVRLGFLPFQGSMIKLRYTFY